jgi:integrase
VDHEGLYDISINQEVALLKCIYTKALEWGYAKDNPAKAVKLLIEPPERVRHLTPDGSLRLLNASALDVKPLVFMVVHTGMCVREILTLTWPQVDMERRFLTMAKTKNQERRLIPLNDQTIEVLGALLRDVESSSVFCDQDGRPYSVW